MVSSLARKIFGSRNDRLLKRYGKAVTQINALEEGLQALSDEELKAKIIARLEILEGKSEVAAADR